MPDKLNKKHLLITRSESQAGDLVSLCQEKNITPVLCPIISVKYLDVSPIEPANPEKTLSVFTSKNAIRLEILEECIGTKIAVLGTETAKRVEALGYEVHLVSSEKSEISLGAEILDMIEKDIEINLFQGSTSSSYLVDLLTGHGYSAKKHIVYEVSPGEYDQEVLKKFVLDSLKEPEEYFISLLSAYTAERFFQEVTKYCEAQDLDSLKRTGQFIVIGERARSYLEQLGVLRISLVGDKSLSGVVKECT